MYIIGELINGMYKRIAAAINEKDAAAIQECALAQVAAGVDALDVNCGPLSRDPLSDMPWLVETIQQVTDKPLSLDASRPAVIEAGLKAARYSGIVNSTTADKEKLEILVPLAKKHKAKLIGITISSKGIPQTKDQRLELAAQITSFCLENDFSPLDLFLDPILLPVNVAQAQMYQILETINEFKIISDPSPRTILGLSNVSQGAKSRRLLNRTFLVMAATFGLDAAILDPLDKALIDALASAELFLNKQIYCDAYLEAFRKR
jgi:5-methyltetrahydrofolate corrinoid/iron sulfur protein methyltransferase